METQRPASIAVIGAESSGKTWLTEKLASHYATSHAPEYARAYFENRDIARCSVEDLLVIAERQLELEEKARREAKGLFFCDSSLITIKVWAELEFGHVPAALLQMMTRNSHDLYLILDNSVTWEADPLRLNKFDRELILKMHLVEVLKTETPYEILYGMRSRLTDAIKKLDQLLNSASA